MTPLGRGARQGSPASSTRKPALQAPSPSTIADTPRFKLWHRSESFPGPKIPR
jgi:hypothetical protein